MKSSETGIEKSREKGGGKEEEIKLQSLEERKARGMQIEAEIIMRESSVSMC